MTPRPHTPFVVCVTLAGVLLMVLGWLRLSVATRSARYSRGRVVTVYSVMILFGAALIAFALHWRFFA